MTTTAPAPYQLITGKWLVDGRGGRPGGAGGGVVGGVEDTGRGGGE